jgi:hypothetical protein
MRLFDLCEDRLLDIDDMFVIHWNISNRQKRTVSRAPDAQPAPFIHGSQNVPHNSPMWRKKMHLWNGGFGPMDGLGCYDFSFWVRALRRGVLIQHINEPLEMYLSRNASHGHRTHHKRERHKWADRWANECDTMNEWASNQFAALLAATRNRLVGRRGRCREKRKARVQVVSVLQSQNQRFRLWIHGKSTICVAPFTLHALPEPHPQLRLVMWRSGKFSHSLCMHTARSSRQVLLQGAQAGMQWCTYTCIRCMLRVDDSGNVLVSNETSVKTLFNLQQQPLAFQDGRSCWNRPTRNDSTTIGHRKTPHLSEFDAWAQPRLTYAQRLAVDQASQAIPIAAAIHRRAVPVRILTL